MANIVVRMRIALSNLHFQQRFNEAVERLAAMSDEQPWNDELRECVEDLTDCGQSFKAIPDGPSHDKHSSGG